MMGIGGWEVIAVLAVVALFFPRKLHSLARSLGECVGIIGGSDHGDGT